MNLMVFNFLSIVHYSITLLCGRVMLLCAGILGRYYTDPHDVDEEMRTISIQGGYWVDHTAAGITHRDMGGTSSYVFPSVASRK